MKLSTSLAASLALTLVLAPGVAAQGRCGSSGASAALVSAPVARSAVQREVRLPVLGLTAGNEAAARRALSDLAASMFACPGCEAEFHEPGECPGCRKQLVEALRPILATVAADAPGAHFDLRTRPGMTLRCSVVGDALRSLGVEVDDRSLAILGEATLEISGASTTEEAQRIETALMVSELFESQQAEWNGSRVRVRVVARVAPGLLWRVREVLSWVDPAFEVTDVVWNDWTPQA